MQVSICAHPVIGIGLALDGFGLVPRLSVSDRGQSPIDGNARRMGQREGHHLMDAGPM